MSSLTIKNLPKSLLSRLRKRALAERRSMNQQVIHLLENALDETVTLREPMSPEAVAEQLAVWRKLCGTWESDESVEDEIRRIYESRTSGREVHL